MDRLVAIAVSRRYLMIGLLVVVIIGGLIAFKQLNIEAYPDPTPPMVDIVTQSPGLSSEEIERYITIPIETQVSGIKNLRTMRTISLYGLSDVKLQFSFDYTYDEALQQVLNRLSQLAPLLGNVQPTISPVSPIGEIYRYRLAGPPNYSVLDLKTLQDWVLQRRFRAVPGVIDVTGWGGRTKTYELQVDFNKLIAYGLTLPQLLQAIGNSNINVGGNTVNIGAQSAVVRGVGLIRSIDDLASTMVSQSGGNPVLVKDIATVTIGEKPRLGIAGLDQDDIVQGIVLMRRGEQSSPTILRVEQLVASINNSSILPPGVRIERIYDRKDLIDITTATVLHNMVVGILLIVLLQWLFLGDLRSALIVGATIPFALFFAVIILVLRGESANLLSVVAVDLLCRRHHYRRLPAAVHVKRRRRQHLRADGADLCLCVGRRAAGDLHRDSRAERDHPAVAYARDRNLDHATAEAAVYAGSGPPSTAPETGDGWGRGPRGHDPRVRPPARTGIPAQARGRQSLDPGDLAADHLASGGQRLCQRDAKDHPQPPRGGIGGVAAWPSRRWHRCRRPVQCGVLCAAKAGERMARYPRQERPDGSIAGAARG